MITAINNTNLDFHREDVDDALWIINTSETLNHGVESLMWAWKVVLWYLNLHREVTYFYYQNIKKGIKRTVEQVLDYVLSLVRSNTLLI